MMGPPSDGPKVAWARGLIGAPVCDAGCDATWRQRQR